MIAVDVAEIAVQLDNESIKLRHRIRLVVSLKQDDHSQPSISLPKSGFHCLHSNLISDPGDCLTHEKAKIDATGASHRSGWPSGVWLVARLSIALFLIYRFTIFQSSFSELHSCISVCSVFSCKVVWIFQTQRGKCVSLSTGGFRDLKLINMVH
jgi:hypothetical protein